jgi:hypothetical protein
VPHIAGYETPGTLDSRSIGSRSSDHSPGPLPFGRSGPVRRKTASVDVEPVLDGGNQRVAADHQEQAIHHEALLAAGPAHYDLRQPRRATGSVF